MPPKDDNKSKEVTKLWEDFCHAKPCLPQPKPSPSRKWLLDKRNPKGPRFLGKPRSQPWRDDKRNPKGRRFAGQLRLRGWATKDKEGNDKEANDKEGSKKKQRKEEETEEESAVLLPLLDALDESSEE